MSSNSSGASKAPFSEKLLLTAEARYKSFASSARSLESLSSGEKLADNPDQAIRARLARIRRHARTGGNELPIAPPGRETLETGQESERAQLERIIGKNALLGVQYLDGGQSAARSVGRVVLRGADGQTQGYGTGFLVSPRLFLTNHHVLEAATVAATSVVEFNYQDGLDGQLMPVTRFAFDPATLFLASPDTELDFALVAVQPVSEEGVPLSQFGFNPLAAVADEILAGESVTIIQHPNGEVKQIALRENEVLKFPEADDQFLHYQTDTNPGSSGSPVYNDQWEVVALHHSGYARRDSSGNILARNGRIWKPIMGEHKIDWVANEGIRVAAIIDHLRHVMGLSPEQQVLLAPVLAAEPASPGESSPSTDSGNNDPAPMAPAPAISLPVNGPSTLVAPLSLPGLGRATWMIPLRVEVSFGEPRLEPMPSGQDTPGNRPVVLPSSSDETSVREALAELERAPARVYYDAATDRAARDGYYRGIGNPDPVAFYKKLNLLVSSTHTTRLSYNPSGQLYPWVDLQPNLKIKSVYSGQQFDPAAFIRDDHEVGRQRNRRFQEFLSTEAAGQEAARTLQWDMLEASLPYNCEHVVPQSWFAKREPMRGDMHHLFACESGCNSFRGNTPYFDFRRPQEAVRVGCGQRETNRFEPTAGKGPVARATLYFLLRYPGEINRTSAEYTEDRLAILIGWHKEFPVNDYERHRNQAIFAKQGNRNPLIDFPEWVDRIAFRRGLGS